MMIAVRHRFIDMNLVWLLIPAAYLLGSISTAVLICRLYGLEDPRTLGSGNPGATNVLRTGSRSAALLTLIGDLMKGLGPVLFARGLEAGETVVGLTAIAAFLGHLFPVYHNFKGGKGVATGLGVLLGIDWITGLFTFVVWLLVAAASRISSLAALVAALSAPVLVYFVEPRLWLPGCTVLISGLLIWRHQRNIQNLLQGTEPRFGKRA
jgi:acyl phosphate:glycerol-3-phosphate acyltransferase